MLTMILIVTVAVPERGSQMELAVTPVTAPLLVMIPARLRPRVTRLKTSPICGPSCNKMAITTMATRTKINAYSTRPCPSSCLRNFLNIFLDMAAKRQGSHTCSFLFQTQMSRSVARDREAGCRKRLRRRLNGAYAFDRVRQEWIATPRDLCLRRGFCLRPMPRR